MKNYSRREHISREDVDLLIVEAFQCANQTMGAFERLTRAALSRSFERDETHQTVEAEAAPEIEGRAEVLVCTIKETCRRTGLGRTRIYQAIQSGELRAMKCGQRTLIQMDEIRRWIASLPTIPSR
jgi:excisionase family DNA binding protein